MKVYKRYEWLLMGKVFCLPWELKILLSCFGLSALYSRIYCNRWPSPPAWHPSTTVKYGIGKLSLIWQKKCRPLPFSHLAVIINLSPLWQNGVRVLSFGRNKYRISYHIHFLIFKIPKRVYCSLKELQQTLFKKELWHTLFQKELKDALFLKEL